MNLIKKIKTLGFGFVFERAFERIVPAWFCRFCSLAVYQVDSDKLPDGSFSKAEMKICDGAQEIERLHEVTCTSGDPGNSIGVVAKINDEVAGGLWVAMGDYEDGHLGLLFLLGEEGSWIFSARVDESYRRQGIYSQLMAESVKVRKNAGHTAPLIGVSKLNKGSYRAIQRVGKPVGEVLVLRLGSMVWARAKGDLKQSNSMTLQCTRHPIQISVPDETLRAAV